MPNLPKISEAEWKVMEIIWHHFPIGGRDVFSLLESRTSWHLKTVKSLLNRLTQKGVVGFEKNKNTYLYSPLISRSKYIDRDSKGFIERLFGGKESQALMFFMQSAELSEDELHQLELLLKEKRRSDYG